MFMRIQGKIIKKKASLGRRLLIKIPNDKFNNLTSDSLILLQYGIWISSYRESELCKLIEKIF